MAKNTLHDLFVTKLTVLLYVENQLVKALTEMSKNATDPDLKAAFEAHLEETKGHVEGVKSCLRELNEEEKELEADGINGIIKDGKWTISNVTKGPALDASLIGAGQHAEHYEISAYGTACEWARLMKHDKVAEILEKILEEEKAADEKLTTLATSKINSQVELGM